MKHTWFNRLVSLGLCLVLIAAMALMCMSCGQQDNPGSEANSVTTETISLGQGATAFTFEVVDKEGTRTVYDIHTDETVVGKALIDLGLIEGQESAYGLLVKTVTGITADFDTDHVYWAFYVNGQYASAGVDSTPITPGATYAFRVES